MAKETDKIVDRYKKLLTNTVFDDKKELLGRVLELAYEDGLFSTKEE